MSKPHAYQRGYKQGHKHASVETALSRVLYLIQHSGIEGLKVESRKGFRFQDQIKKGSLHFEWVHGWAATDVYTVSMTVDVDSHTANLNTGLVRLKVRMQWAPIANSLAQRTAILELATQVNSLSARVETLIDGDFILHEKTYDNYIKGNS